MPCPYRSRFEGRNTQMARCTACVKINKADDPIYVYENGKRRGTLQVAKRSVGAQHAVP